MSLVTTIRSDRRTARKAHRCDLCDRTIQPGETYESSTNIWEGSFLTWKACGHCCVMIALLYAARDSGFDPNNDEGYDSDSVREWEPGTPAYLRLKALWQMQWTRRDGTLHPVPCKETP